MKLIDLIDDMEVKKWVLIFCILGVSFTDNVGDIKLAEVFSNKKVKEWGLDILYRWCVSTCFKGIDKNIIMVSIKWI